MRSNTPVGSIERSRNARPCVVRGAPCRSGPRALVERAPPDADAHDHPRHSDPADRTAPTGDTESPCQASRASAYSRSQTLRDERSAGTSGTRTSRTGRARDQSRLTALRRRHSLARDSRTHTSAPQLRRPRIRTRASEPLPDHRAAECRPASAQPNSRRTARHSAPRWRSRSRGRHRVRSRDRSRRDAHDRGSISSEASSHRDR